MATKSFPGRTSCTLYELEDNLQALVHSIDLAEEPSARESILEEIGQALRKTAEKRDSVVGFLHHCAMQQRFADAEIDRIQKRKASIARLQEELEAYLVHVVEQYAKPDRRGIQRLEGNFSSMRIQKNPDSVLITDLDAVPLAFKQAILGHAGLRLGSATSESRDLRSARPGKHASKSWSSSQTRRRSAPS